LNVKCDHCELLAVRCNIGANQIILVNCYRSDVSKVGFLDELKEVLGKLNKLKLPVIFCGDLNLPGVDWANQTADNVYSQPLFLALFSEFGYTQHVTEATWSRNVLDAVPANEPMLVNNVNVAAPLGISDHDVVVCDVNIPVVPNNQSSSTYLKWSAADFTGLMLSLELTNWCDMFANCSADAMYEYFCKFCTALFEIFVPRGTRKIAIGGSRRKYPTAVKRLLSDKRKICRKYKANRTSSNKRKLKAISEKCKKALKNALRVAEEKILHSCSQKKFYAYVNFKMTSKPSVSALEENGALFEDDASKAQILNEQFSSVFVQDSGIPLGGIQGANDQRMPENTFRFTRPAIVSAIKKLKSDCSCGPDGIPAVFLKECAEQLAVPLEIIFNKSLAEGKLPTLWKMANVVPIYKGKGSAAKAVNYRPVSLTSLCGKLMESIIKSEIMGF
jgi:hypothetical protein